MAGRDKLVFQIIFFVYLVILFFFGMTISGLCLREQDICYILAMGRLIVENGQLPQSDPFSWTYAIYPNGFPYVVHQWLTDIIFFLLVKTIGAISLVLVTALAFSLAFVLLPLKLMQYLRLRPIQVLLLLSISVFAACAHLQVRPEIFSFIFISFLYVLLVKADQEKRLTNGSLILLILSMALWSNLHSGFVAGIAILFFWFIFSFIDRVLLQKAKLDLNYVLMIPACLAATLINPYGYKLWLYLPSLYFSPISHYINEWHHFGWDFFACAICYPMFLLIILFIVAVYKSLKVMNIEEIGTKPVALGLAATLVGLHASRFMNIASLALIVAIGLLLAKLNEKKEKTLNNENRAVLDVYRPLFSLVSLALIVISTALITVEVMPAEIPEGYAGFSVPVEAMKFLQKQPQSGRLLNESQYGDIIVWYMQSPPKTFIDSRFDLYSPRLVEGYFKMVDCKPGWRDYLKSFAIDWVFLPPGLPLAQSLSKDKGWRTVYVDQAALILHKKTIPIQ